jgi:hypothetical protein
MESKLTGRARVRTSFFGKLILQVEEEIELRPTLEESYGSAEPTRYVRQWRDAKWTDGELKWKTK